jgi:hypothetical protein
MLKIKENGKMGNKLVIGILIFVSAIAATTIYKLQAEVITLEEKLANTESANEVLVEQLKQIIGGR